MPGRYANDGGTALAFKKLLAHLSWKQQLKKNQ